MSLGKWIFEDYGVPFIVLQAGQTLLDIKNEIVSRGLALNHTILIYYSNKWRAGRFNHILPSSLDDPLLLDVKTEDLPLALVDEVISSNTEETSDDIVDRLLRFARQIFIVVSEENNPIGVLANTDMNDDEPQPVCFTALYSRPLAAENEALILVYAHLEGLRDEIISDSNRYINRLGDTIDRPRRSRLSPEIKRGTRLTIAPEVEIKYSSLITFRQSSITFPWDYDWEVFPFTCIPHKESIGQLIPVHISVQIADVEVAGIDIALEVIAADQSATFVPSEPARLHQKIFISYSRKDTEVVRRYYQAQIAAANDVFLDVESIRAGDDWMKEVKHALDKADFVQLFWSEHSAASPNVQFEWEYFVDNRCTGNDCEGRLRPVYWSQPVAPVPKKLKDINFRYVPLM